ncbi:MAG: hypothetical protein M1595_00695 [Candidatus Thermoplasmatota archaeon]|jgi:hypothetical protein|nr:hypothetical protein [Candidatus Thermoplasmatota archaeon]
MEFEAKIPLALDPRGITTSIDEASQKPRYYRCIKCNDYLQVRHGDIRAWYFAHYPQTSDSPECSLRTTGGVTDLIEELRTSPIEKYEKSHNLRIAIVPNIYTGIAKVVALIQNPFTELDYEKDKIESILKTLDIKGAGLLTAFDKRIFQVGKPLVKLELDPDAKVYQLDFESNPELKGFTGSWCSDAINIGDIFSGNLNLFERVEKYRKIPESSSIFQVVATAPNIDSLCVLKIGKKFVIEKKIDEVMKKNDEEKTSFDISLKSFEIDVIQPRLSDPSGDDVIYGLPNSQALLAIRPRKGLDPKFEIVTVPKKPDVMTEIERKGNDKIRYQWINFPSFGSNRMSIHNADSHVYLHLFAKEESVENIDLNMGKSLFGITFINNENKIETVYAWQNRKIYLKRTLFPKVKVFQPAEFSIDIEIESFKRDSGLPVKKSLSNVELTSFIDTLSDEGYNAFLLKFKGFGSVRIVFSEPQQKMGLTEIAKRINILGVDLHSRVTWDMVRRICDVPAGTSHKNLHEIITPKKVRRVLKHLREGGKFLD